MVRGPAAVLALGAAALAWFVLAPALPVERPGAAGTVLAGAVGLAFVVAIASAPAVAVTARVVLVPALVAGGLLAAGFDAAGAEASATPAEALFLGCLGVGFATLLDAPALALALPLFVGAVDAVSVLGGGPSTLLADEPARGGDPLTLALPALGGGVPAARLAAVDVVFVGALAGYAESRRLGVVAAGAGMLAGLCAALVLDAAAGVSAPALALMAAGFLVACAGRLPGVARPAARRR